MSDKPRVTGDKKRRKRRKRRNTTFDVYVNKVLKLMHPGTRLSRMTMAIVNSFLNDILQRISVEASLLAHYNKRSTIGPRELQTAVRLILPGQLAKFSAIEGAKAVRRYASSK
ncbi:histone H2B-like [Branchiostoma lanceolatum]|uniref:histone H2B-like n=1 Tax=Branchiostoma lanceolatum TaxID=7740 RepID=UPI003452A5D5